MAPFPTLEEIVAVVLDKMVPAAKEAAAERGIPAEASEQIVQIIEEHMAAIDLLNLPAEIGAAARELLETGRGPIALSDTDTA